MQACEEQTQESQVQKDTTEIPEKGRETREKQTQSNNSLLGMKKTLRTRIQELFNSEPMGTEYTMSQLVQELDADDSNTQKQLKALVNGGFLKEKVTEPTHFKTKIISYHLPNNNK